MAGRADDIDEIAATWLARRDAGTLSDDSEVELQAWLDADAAHRVAYLRLQAAWDQSDRLQALAAGLRGDRPPPRGAWSSLPVEHGARHDAGPDLREITFRRPTTRKHSPLPALAAAASLAMVAIALGWAWLTHNAVEASSHRSAFGTIETIALADGSRSTLASDSHIDVRLSRHERRIDLQQGEAFFEAAKDPGRPFVVEAGSRRVVAVGTRFSVRRDGPDLRVVVIEGIVRLESEAIAGTPQPAAMLPAGSIALVHRDGVLVRSLPLAEVEQMLDWRSGLLVFRDTSLAEAATEFNRYNVRKIVIADETVADLRIGGSFRWENAEGFVRLLEQGFPVRADYGRDRIVLHTP